MAPFRKMLVANRGEIAIRVLRAASELGIETVAVFSRDDEDCLHHKKADSAVPLGGSGVKAYLDIDAVLAAADAAGCDAIHPGYGFLSENPDFARRCEAAGIAFIGPSPEALSLFGDKSAARQLAQRCGVPIARGTVSPTALADAQAFARALGGDAALMVKAVAGGGGRGIRIVRDLADLPDAMERSISEARAAFGNGDVYVEEFISRARHVEVQVIGDTLGEVAYIWERECSLQRQNQKIIEIAPAPGLDPGLRKRIHDAATSMAREVAYRGLATFEFLVAADGGSFIFMEANPRLQVEHTVTEAVTGIDLVQAQIRVCAGQSLAQLGLAQTDVPAPRGLAMQLRINAERMQPDGRARPSGGIIAAFEPPSGAGLRTDTLGYAGYGINASFDSLLAKLIVHTGSPDFAVLVAKAQRALREFRIEGVDTNIGFLLGVLARPEVLANDVHTRFLDENMAELVAAVADYVPLFHAGKAGAAATAERRRVAPVPGAEAVDSPVQGKAVQVLVAEGDAVARGAPLIVVEAMKMEHEIRSPVSGTVVKLTAASGQPVYENEPVAFVAADGNDNAGATVVADEDPGAVRPDLQELLDRRALLGDAARPEAVARRHDKGHMTAREIVDAIADPGSFQEILSLVVASQGLRRTEDWLVRNTPADGLITGTASINAERFGKADARCALLVYDYMVMAGTQGRHSHLKADRLCDVALGARLPVVFFLEGGGGRPSDEGPINNRTFVQFPRLSGKVPVVGIVTGYCFAGNAAVLGCCDVVIATRDSNIGMGGPAMIEGGGLGVFSAKEIGPGHEQTASGVIDILAEDDAEAIDLARKYLSYFQGRFDDWSCADQTLLRGVIPMDRRRAFEIRDLIRILADTDSVMELRRDFGRPVVTCLIRIEGRPVGLIANDSRHLGGAIDSDGADKAARFMQLCDGYGIPLVSLCDTPGIMVGPEAERTGLVRHASRMLLVGANLSIPLIAIIVRKAYGVGRIAMAGGNFMVATHTSLAWPTAEFGGMNLEGAVKLGYRRELEAVEDPAERQARYEEMVARLYREGRAIPQAMNMYFDDVIDPAETRARIVASLDALNPGRPAGGRRSFIDAW